MFESGSHTPGVSAADFGVPPGMALRYERPADAIARHVTSYVVMDSEPNGDIGTADWMLPSWSQIWIVFGSDPVALRIGNFHYPALPTATLMGPTSRAMPVTSNGGGAIVADISPLGWGRLFRQPAARFADRVVPLDTVMPAAVFANLLSELNYPACVPDTKMILDRFFTEVLAYGYDDEPLVDAVMTAIMDDDLVDATSVARRVGIDRRQLLTLSHRYFGFPTTTLLLRARFLKAMLPLMDTTSGADVRTIPPRYHDASHFNRDARRFLGTTPRRFLALHKPYCESAIRARVAVLGSALSALDFGRI
ncbi:MAG: helix-turn-helix domain-containing protein [Pseudomonadota bacterium]